MGNLKVIKLVTGEEILGVVYDGKNYEQSSYLGGDLIFVSGPLKITTEYDKASKTHSLYLSDWIPALTDEAFPIQKQKILTIGNPTKHLEEHYLELALLSHLDIDDSDDFNDDDLQ
jgi:hypothetical protein